MSEQKVTKAKVILKGAHSYTVGGKRYIKDVPVIIKGSATVAEFQANGYFRVIPLESKVVSTKEESKAEGLVSSKGSSSEKKKLKKNKLNKRG